MNRKKNIDKLMIKLKVLNSRIQKLDSLADNVLQEVESAYLQQLNELLQKKETAQQKISKLQKTDDKEKVTP